MIAKLVCGQNANVSFKSERSKHGINVLFQGHDTTAAGIFWSLYFIGSHPSVQQKVQEDVDNFYGL